jgi:hypothetical protein
MEGELHVSLLWNGDKVLEVAVFQDAFSHDFVPPIGVLLPNQQLINVSRARGKTCYLASMAGAIKRDLSNMSASPDSTSRS